MLSGKYQRAHIVKYLLTHLEEKLLEEVCCVSYQVEQDSGEEDCEKGP